MSIWEQYQKIAYIFARWGQEKADEVTNTVLEFCKNGIGLEQHKGGWFRNVTFESPSPDVQYLLEVTDLKSHMALRIAIEGYSRLSAEKKAELVARKIPGEPKRTGWR